MGVNVHHFSGGHSSERRQGVYYYGALGFVEQTRGVENGDDNRAVFGDTRFWTRID